jgi:3-oxoacyl-[acyl-carrier-protein] synthase III
MIPSRISDFGLGMTLLSFALIALGAPGNYVDGRLTHVDSSASAPHSGTAHRLRYIGIGTSAQAQGHAPAGPTSCFGGGTVTHTRFESIGIYLPSNVLSTSELVRQMSYQPLFDLRQITGIESRRVHDKRPDSYEDSFILALRAAEDCLSRSRYDAGDIDVVISASITRFKGADRFYFEPSFAHALAGALGARSAVHFDVSNACAGMMTGVAILDRMIKAGVVRNGLVVSGEQITAIAETAVKEIAEVYDPQFGSLTVGDSAAAIIVDESTSDADRIHYIELMTCAEYSHLCIGKPSDRNQGIALYTDNQQMHKEDRSRLWTTFQSDFLAKRGSTFAAEGYDYIIHHQVSTRFISNLNRYGEKAFGTRMPESLAVVDRYGNTSTTSHFLVLHDHLASGRAKKGATYLFVPAASGVVTGCVSATITSLEV